MAYDQVLSSYKVLVNQLVGSKVATDSIDPTDVASIGIQLADLLIPILNSINDFAITGGTLPPDDANGIDFDLYIQGGTSLIFWRKRNDIWVQEASVALGIQIVDGNITLQASVNEQVVTVSAGSWGINNIVYSKAVQTQLNLTAADLNFNRIDTIVADAAGAVYLLNGVASSNPNPAALPVNSIVVNYVYIPASSSGDLPYISDSNSPPVPIYDVPKPWTAEATPLDGYRSKFIGEIEYLFRSEADGNISEPSLSQGSAGVSAWQKFNGPVLSWDDAIPFDLDQLVLNPYFSFTWMYKSNVAANLNHDPSAGDTEFWETVGNYLGAVGGQDYYKKNDVVIDGNGDGWKSLILNNNYALGAIAPPWRKADEVAGTIPAYDYFETYEKGNYVKMTVNIGGVDRDIVYQSKQDSNHQEIPTGDDFDAYWRTVGTFYGEYAEGTTYSEYAVVVSTQEGLTNIYISNKADNTNDVTTGVGSSTWQVVGYVPSAPLTFTQANLVEVDEGNYSLSFNLPDGKSIASIETKAGTVTRHLSPSQAVTDTANSPNTIIEGFDNNAAQTITIKLI